MQLRKVPRSTLCVSLLSLLIPTALLAQSGRGVLRGQITDPSGAAIPAISVSVTGPGGASLVSETDAEGKYVFRNLPPGTYTLQIQLKGFATFQKAGIVIASGHAAVEDARLQVALEKQQVTVESESATVSTSGENNASSLVIKGKDLEALSDDPDELQNELTALAGPSAGPNGGEIYIDGFSGGQLPPKSSIREIRVNQNPFSAQYDKLGYGRIEILTKPGTDHLHGQFFFNENDNAFNSRNPFASQVPAYHSEIYDGNLGDALGKKASFFLDVQRRQIQDANVVNAMVLSPDLTSQIPLSQSILTPQTRTSFGPRVDYQVSTNNTLTLHYHLFKDDQTSQGVGQFNLASQAYNSGRTSHNVQISDTQVISTRTVNETRFAYRRSSLNERPTSATSAEPTVQVLQSFTSGGSMVGMSLNNTNYFEVQNLTSMAVGKHMVKFGARLRKTGDTSSVTSNFNGVFTFSSLGDYQAAELALQGCAVPGTCQVGGASQFSITSGNPRVHANYLDFEPYAEDEWRIKPNMTLSAGLRFETQNYIHDRADFAPRVGFAWGIGGGRKQSAQTVLRAGFGVFYDRFGDNLILNAERLNGLTQEQYVIVRPDFFPNLPTPAQLAAAATSPTLYQIDRNLRAPYSTQAGVGLERQLAKNATVAVTYLNTHGVHQLLTNNINAPLPGTYDASVPSTEPPPNNIGVRPFGSVGNIYEYESVGLFNQNQLITNFNIRGKRLSLFGFYTLSYANSDASSTGGGFGGGGTSGAIPGFVSNPYDIHSDYGRAAFDVRHRLFMGGSYSLPRGFQLFPFMLAQSGQPFNITLGRDLNGDSLYNDRPAFANGSTGSNVVATKYGNFNIAPAASEVCDPV